MSDPEPVIAFRPRGRGAPSSSQPAATGLQTASSEPRAPQTRFSRQELSDILAVYGRKVAAGEWRDYAIDLGQDKAVFSVFRKSSEWPLIRIEKVPKLARRQGAYSVVAAGGMILKRGHDLKRVLGVLEKSVAAVP